MAAADPVDQEAEAIAAAQRPRSCGACGRTFIGSAFTVAHDGRCLPDSMIESQLLLVDGVWTLRGTDAASR
jgi:hypothetical protein